MLTKHLYHNHQQLSNNALSGIWEEARIAQSEFLDLSGNSFTEITFPTDALTHLKVLELSNNQAAVELLKIPAAIFPNLQYLYCYDSKIKTFAIEGKFEHLQGIVLAKNPITNIDNEFFESATENLWIKLRDSLNAIVDDTSIPNDQIKLLLLGNSTAGKSSFINFLNIGEYDKNNVSTHGLEHIVWKPYKDDKEATEDEKKLIVSVWDFGGQEFYHSTHSLFFTNNAVYIVVFECATSFQGKKLTTINLYDGGEKKKQKSIWSILTILIG